MKRCFLPALAGVLLCLGFVPAGHAIEILRWERLPLAVPLVVGQERVVFIERNVRIGVPAGVAEQLRVQSARAASPHSNPCASSRAMCRPPATASRPAPRPPWTTMRSARHQPPAAQRRWPWC